MVNGTEKCNEVHQTKIIFNWSSENGKWLNTIHISVDFSVVLCVQHGSIEFHTEPNKSIA